MQIADQFFMKKAIHLAQKGRGRTFPNPMVGAVIVKNDKIISKGYHKTFGGDHAEVDAIKNAKGNLNDSTIFVNLEPCNHHGKTPPCTDLIIKSGIKKVVIANLDPNKKVKGNGVEVLRKAGINIIERVMSRAGETLNEAYFNFHIKNRPFVALKFAASLDGKIATRTGDSKWITNEKARKYSSSLRSNYQAILVGINTVLTDNPNLGSGIKSAYNPLRIILDSKLRIPLSADVLRDKNALIVTTKNTDSKKEYELIKKGIDILKLNLDKIDIKMLLKELTKKDIISLFVEGGGEVLGSFVDAGVVDKVYAFHAPLIIGGRKSISAIMGEGSSEISKSLKLKNIARKHFEDNILTTGYVA